MSSNLSDDLSPPDTHERASCHAPARAESTRAHGAPVIREDCSEVLGVVVGARR